MTATDISNHKDLWKLVFVNLVLSLAGRISKSVRGITIGFDGETIRLVVFFDTPPSESDIEDMRDVEAELVSHHEYQSDLVFSVVPVSESLIEKVDNWGWIFLRREE
ncbi:hypothetical protein [Pseudomonas sp.]|uniref:hypothetical protein n=1 Tax=Pseudomonas sp. TaxID=306 RepID=UPI003A97A437